ncbi:hypothetical protein QBC42DRAFT_174468 [Cladorrhinum samala]|uniref:Protein kinase domain-containing protein n=1 Tax=Cladorrhinum samala TaxID=585594 RepID=A0AAV9HQ56_9PEZI|nr:hypothetical protein QBC42DRAFT_174468 [Cladorrhinum samala]
MLVEVLNRDPDSRPRLPSAAVLKLYDRRFSEGFRENRRCDPWEREIEDSYVDFVQSGGFDKFISRIHQVPEAYYDARYEPQDDDESWGDGECESALADECSAMFNKETAAHETLRNLQGLLIPKLLARVEIDVGPPSIVPEEKEDAKHISSHGLEPFKVKGILMQHLEGFPLREIPDRCRASPSPRSAWQDITDQAVSIARVVNDYGIINYDVRTENFIVAECLPGAGPQGRRYRVYMIDFGNCRHRWKGESDFEWGRENSLWGQDDHVGYTMMGVLKEHGFELEYESDGRWDAWAAKEDFRPPAGSGWALETRGEEKVWVPPEYSGTVRHIE